MALDILDGHGKPAAENHYLEDPSTLHEQGMCYSEYSVTPTGVLLWLKGIPGIAPSVCSGYLRVRYWSVGLRASPRFLPVSLMTWRSRHQSQNNS